MNAPKEPFWKMGEEQYMQEVSLKSSRSEVQELSLINQLRIRPDLVLYTFNPSTQESEAGGWISLSLWPTWST